MHGENGTPSTPDWTPQPGNTCGNCAATSNYCHVIETIDHMPCCGSCSHCSPLVMPLTWAGDDG